MTPADALQSAQQAHAQALESERLAEAHYQRVIAETAANGGAASAPDIVKARQTSLDASTAVDIARAWMEQAQQAFHEAEIDALQANGAKLKADLVKALELCTKRKAELDAGLDVCRQLAAKLHDAEVSRNDVFILGQQHDASVDAKTKTNPLLAVLHSSERGYSRLGPVRGYSHYEVELVDPSKRGLFGSRK
ncbi:MAG: hypothetical protein AB7C98_09095 [Acidithiobacillus sp.]